jgi:hypothetical protein
MKGAAFPMGLMQVGDNTDRPTSDELASIHSTHKNAVPGERFTVSYPIEYKVIGPATAETRILGEVLAFLQDRKIDGLMVAPISKQHQRTLASAEVMEDDTDTGIVLPVQRLLKRVVERQVYRPYLMTRGQSVKNVPSLGQSVKNVPSLSFHPPDEDREEQALFYIGLVNANIISREAAARELGIDPGDIPSEEDVMKQMQPTGVIPPNGFPKQKQAGSSEETVKIPPFERRPYETPEQALNRRLFGEEAEMGVIYRVRVDREPEAHDEDDRGHRHDHR